MDEPSKVGLAAHPDRHLERIEGKLRPQGRRHALEVTMVRPANVYGPWQEPHDEGGVVAIFAHAMLRGGPVTIFGDGGQTRDYVFVGDVVSALLRAAEAPVSTCNVGTGIETTTRELFDRLAALTGYPHTPRHAPEREGDTSRSVLDPSGAAAAWGWRAAVSLDEGLRATVDWFRAQRA